MATQVFNRGIVNLEWGGNALGKGSFGEVFRGNLGSTHNNDIAMVAVKLIGEENVMDVERLRREYDQMKDIKHENILNIMHFFEDPCNKRYILVMELCHTVNLYDYVTKKEDENVKSIKMPHYVEVLRQIADGLNYLHENGLVHRDIKPLNILLSLNDDPVKMKIGDFGEVKPLIDEEQFQLSFVVGTAIYHAPEVISALSDISNEVDLQDFKKTQAFLRENNFFFTKAIDNFACGCTFYFFLRDGVHPFGKSTTSIRNIEKENEQAMSEEDPDRYFAVEIALDLIAHDPDKRISLPEVMLRLSKHPTFMTELGWDERSLQGTVGSLVEFTNFGGNEIAVKRFLADDDHISQTIDNETIKQLKHPSLISVIEIFDRPNFKYIGMERCAGSLQDHFDNSLGGATLPGRNEGLRQLSDGLAFVHSKNYVHGELRPCNILILNEPNKSAQLKLAEFGISRFDSSVELRRPYYAPELLYNEEDDNANGLEKPNAECDVFAMGCIFYGYATCGGHPFLTTNGSLKDIPDNIKNGIYNVDGDILEPWLKELIEAMIAPGGRVTSRVAEKKIRENTRDATP